MPYLAVFLSIRGTGPAISPKNSTVCLCPSRQQRPLCFVRCPKSSCVPYSRCMFLFVSLLHHFLGTHPVAALAHSLLLGVSPFTTCPAFSATLPHPGALGRLLSCSLSSGLEDPSSSGLRRTFPPFFLHPSCHLHHPLCFNIWAVSSSSPTV